VGAVVSEQQTKGKINYEIETNKRRAGNDSHIGNGNLHCDIGRHSHCDFSLGLLGIYRGKLLEV
jgi:hypothetical protein